MILECYNYSEEKKVKLAAVEFKDYALVWWDQLLVRRRRHGLRGVTTWAEMKEILRERFVPPHYGREVKLRLQQLTQGSRSITKPCKLP